MGNVVFLLGDGRWGPCAQLTFQKYHLLYRPTACTSWKVLDLDDKDNRQKHQKGTLLQIIYQKGTLLQLFLGGG